MTYGIAICILIIAVIISIRLEKYAIRNLTLEESKIIAAHMGLRPYHLIILVIFISSGWYRSNNTNIDTPIAISIITLLVLSVFGGPAYEHIKLVKFNLPKKVLIQHYISKMVLYLGTGMFIFLLQK